MGELVQRYIITHRPDLIKQINLLRPNLRKEFSPELNLTDIEI